MKGPVQVLDNTQENMTNKSGSEKQEVFHVIDFTDLDVISLPNFIGGF